MMTAEENKRKIIQNNIRMSLLFAVTIIGIGVAIYFYGKLKDTNGKLRDTTASLESAKKDLKNAYDTLEKINQALSDTKKKLENILDAASQAPNPETVLKPIAVKRDAAREYARIGYDKLKKNDLAGAMDAFHSSEESYHGYRDSYEVYLMLYKNRDSLNDRRVQQRLLEKIQKDYNSLQILKRSDIR